MSLERFERHQRTYEGVTRTVYQAGSGPGIVVMHEMPGLHPGVRDFAIELLDAGFTVWMPSMFGEDERPVDPVYATASIVRACISKEFTAWRTGVNSPITTWLRALSKDLAEHTEGPVGAVGMCFTGGFALAMMVDPWVAAPVCSQPSLPLAVFPWQRRDVGVDDATLDAIRARVAEGACVLGLRYRNDVMVPPARFDRLHRELGEGFEALVVDDWRPWKHAVLTLHRHEPAVVRVMEFFRERLKRSNVD